MQNRTFKYRLTFQFAKKGVLNIPDGAEPNATQLEYPQDDGHPVILKAAGNSFHASEQFKIMRGGFPSPKDAWDEAREVLLALALVSAELKLGFNAGDVNVGDYSPEKALPGQDLIFSDSMLAELEKENRIHAVAHKLGITIVEQSDSTYGIRSFQMSTQIAPFSLTPIGLIHAMCQIADQRPTIDARTSLALEIYNQSVFEQNRTAFLMLIQMLESLKEETERSPKVIEFLQYLHGQTKEERKKAGKEKRYMDQQSLERIMNSLSDLKKESITQSIIKMVENDCGQTFLHGGSIAGFIKTCYKVRSALTHKGTAEIPEKEFSDYLGGLRNICREILRKRMGYEPISLDPTDVSPTVLHTGMTQF